MSTNEKFHFRKYDKKDLKKGKPSRQTEREREREREREIDQPQI